MKNKHVADLVWRFMEAEEARSNSVPSGLATLQRILERGGPKPSGEVGLCVTDRQLEAQRRIERIDHVLARLTQKPISFARVLKLRYGFDEERSALRDGLPYTSGVALLTTASKRWFERLMKNPARPRSHDVRDWLERICAKVSLRGASLEEQLALNAIGAEADDLVRRASAEYQRIADGQAESRCAA